MSAGGIYRLSGSSRQRGLLENARSCWISKGVSVDVSLPRILVVDDNEEIHRDYRKVLESGAAASRVDALANALFDADPTSQTSVTQPRYAIDSAFQGQEALERVLAAKSSGQPYAMAFVDMRMPPGWDGMRTIEELWKADEDLEVVICTAYADYSWDDLLRRFGTRDQLLILKKPFDTAEVSQLACALTKKWSLARAARLNLEELQEMVHARTVSLEKANTRLERELEQRAALEECLRTSETRYAIAARAANDGLWDWDLASGRVYYSTRWKSLMGCADHEIGATTKEWLDRVHPADVARLEGALEGLAAAGEGGERLRLARAVEGAALAVLRERHPERPLAANVEFMTAVLLEAIGLPRTLFSGTFAAARAAGWIAHVDEQRRAGRLIRPQARYVGPRPEAVPEEARP